MFRLNTIRRHQALLQAYKRRSILHLLQYAYSVKDTARMKRVMWSL